MTSETIIINAFVLPLGFKASQADANIGSILDTYNEQKPKDAGNAPLKFIHEFQEKRKYAITALSDLNSEWPVKDELITSYLELCVSLCRSLNPEAPQGTATQSSPELRKFATFAWKDKFAGTGSRSINDVCFEVCNILLSDATWDLCQAVHMISAMPNGLNPDAASKVHKLLCTAAERLQTICGVVLPQLREPAGADLDKNFLRMLQRSCMGDAQGMTVQRALATGRPSKIVSQVAHDTALLYAQALQDLATAAGQASAAVSNEPWDMSNVDVRKFSGVYGKVAPYLKYKNALFAAVALVYGGLELMERDKAGPGVKLAQDGERLLKLSIAFAQQYDLAQPPTDGRAHAAFDAELQQQVTTTFQRIIKDNETIYYGNVPATSPPLLPATRLIELVDKKLPAPADEILTDDAAKDLILFITNPVKVEPKPAAAAVVDGAKEAEKGEGEKQAEKVPAESEGSGGNMRQPKALSSFATATNEAQTAVEEAAKLPPTEPEGKPPAPPPKKGCCSVM